MSTERTYTYRYMIFQQYIESYHNCASIQSRTTIFGLQSILVTTTQYVEIPNGYFYHSHDQPLENYVSTAYLTLIDPFLKLDFNHLFN